MDGQTDVRTLRPALLSQPKNDDIPTSTLCDRKTCDPRMLIIDTC